MFYLQSTLLIKDWKFINRLGLVRVMYKVFSPTLIIRGIPADLSKMVELFNLKLKLEAV